MIIIQIFSLFGEILLKGDADVSSKLDKIDKKGNSVSKSMGKAFGAIGKASLVVGTAIVAGLGWAMTEGVKGVVAMEDATAQMNAVLKSTKNASGMTSAALLKMASAMQLTTKFAEEDVMAAQNMLLTFTNIGKETFPLATETLLDLATAMGTDAKGGAIQLGKALNDPEKGITALTRVGVTFTEEQKKVIKKLQETGDMAGAQKVILAELTKEFGGSAKAAGETFSGKLVILKNKLGELTEGFASGFMPYLQKFMDWVSLNMPTIQSVMQKAFDVIGKVLVVVGNYVTETVIPALQELWEWIKPYMPQIKQFVSDTFTTIKEVMKGASDFINTYVLPIYRSLSKWFTENFPKIKDAVMQAYNYIKPSFDKLVATVKSDVIPIITGLWDTIKLAMPGIKIVFQIAFAIIVAVVKTVIDIIVEVIHVIKGIYDFIKPGLDLVAKIFSAVFGGIKKIIDSVQKVLNIFNGTPVKDKKSTVTTTYKSNFSASPNPTGGSGYYSGGGSFAVGTRYLPKDMIIQAHEGEMIVPKSENPYANSGGGTIPTKPEQHFHIDKFIVQSKGDEVNTLSQLQFMTAI